MADWALYGFLIAVGLNVLVSVYRGDWRLVWIPRGGAWLWTLYAVHALIAAGVVLSVFDLAGRSVVVSLMTGSIVALQVMTVGAKLLRVDRPAEGRAVEG